MSSSNLESLSGKGTIITFYSYKGGTGRSMALANVACILAERQQELSKQFPHQGVKGVLMIDWDLEAPGLHRYFKNYLKHYQDNNAESTLGFDQSPGLIDFFSDLHRRIETDFPGDEEIPEELVRPMLHQANIDRCIAQTDIPYLSLLKAGRFDEEYPTRVSRFRWEGLFLRTDQLFLSWAEQLAEQYSYVLIDSRTGATDTSNICSMLMPEKLVAVFTPNAQSLTGITGLIEQAIHYRANSDDSRPLVVFPLPSRIDLSEQTLREFWRYGDRESDIVGYQPTFEKLFQRVYQRSEADCHLKTYFNETQIQHVPRYSYGEDIAVRLERREAGRLSLSSSYRKFTEILFKEGPWEEAPPDKGQTKRIELVEIEALSARSSTQRKAYDYLGALVTSFQAAKKLQRLEENVPKSVKVRVVDRLERVVRSIREKNRFDGHGDDVWDLSFSPSGKSFVSSSEDRTLKLWSLEGELLGNFSGHDGKIRDVSYSPVGDYIASASEDRTVRLWQPDGSTIKILRGHRDIVLSVTFSPSGQLLASCGADRTIKLWKLDGTLVKTIDAHDDRVWDLSFHPDGDRFASASEDGTVKIWNLEGELLQTFESKEHKFFSVAFSPDKKTIAAGGEGQGILRWTLNGQKLRGCFGHQDKVYCVTFNADGSKLATASADKTLRIWTTDGIEVDNLRGHNNDVRCVRFHPSGKWLASGGGDNVIRLWTSEPTDTSPPDGHNSVVLKAKFSPNGEKILSCGGRNEIKLWTLSGELLRNFGDKDPESKIIIRDVCFQPRLQSNQREPDRLIASGGDDETVKLWSHSRKEPIHTLQHGAKIRAVSFHPKGDLLLSAGAEATLKLWRYTGQLVQDDFSGHSDWILDAAFSPDGQTIASASADGTIRIWDLSGQSLKNWKENQNGHWVYSLAFSPDGQSLVSTSGQQLRLWDVETGRLRHTFIDPRGHDDAVYEVAFHPNGEMILSASHDQTIKVWSVGGVFLKTFNEHHNGAVSSVSVHSNGKQFISASHDKSIKLWTLEGTTDPKEPTDPICTMPRNDRIPNVDDLLKKACAWLDDYLWTNQNISVSDRYICSDMLFEKEQTEEAS